MPRRIRSLRIRLKRNDWYPWTNIMRRLNGSTDRKSTRLNSSHLVISYAVFCLKKKNIYRSAYGRAASPGELSSLHEQPPSTTLHSLRHANTHHLLQPSIHPYI